MKLGMPWPGRGLAAEAEAAGIGAFCTGEFVDHEAYTTLTEMVASTETALVGPAIAYAFARTPYAHAAAMRGLAGAAGDRLFLGLGSGAARINRDWFGVPPERPVERMADLVAAVRVWLHAENGRPVRYAGEFYSIDADVRAPVLGRLDIPVLMAGFNKRMATTAARVADGLIGHGLFTRSWWADVVRPAVDSGVAARQGDEAAHERRPVEHGWVITAVDDAAPERAVADARRMIAFYLTVKTYDPYVAHHGWEAPVERIRAAFRVGDSDGMGAAVTDDMLAEIAVCGSTADARETLRRRTGSLPRDVAYFAPPSYLVSPRRKEAYGRAVLGLLDVIPAGG